MKKSAELQALYIARDGFASKVDFDVRIFVFSSCDFVDRSFCLEKLRTIHEVTLTNTNQNHPASRLDPALRQSLVSPHIKRWLSHVSRRLMISTGQIEGIDWFGQRQSLTGQCKLSSDLKRSLVTASFGVLAPPLNQS